LRRTLPHPTYPPWTGDHSVATVFLSLLKAQRGLWRIVIKFNR
jgi:hypothetical protein